MIEESFEAPSPKDAFILARKKYPHISNLKLIKASQRLDENGKLIATVMVLVPMEDYISSLELGNNESKKSFVDKTIELWNSKGIPKKWLDEKISKIEKSGKGIKNSKILHKALIKELKKSIKVVNRDESISNRKIMMLVGPTGVGKTTTVAKLASRYSYMLDNRYKVALINLDTWRAGAYEQLDDFAKILQLKHYKIDGIKEFNNKIDSLRDMDIILVDTAGVSPFDTKRLIHTVEFLKTVQNINISGSLVIPATAKYEDICDIYDYFNFINIENIIITKFDETRRIGDIVAFLIEHDVSVSYLSVGQSVPEDLLLATKKSILKQFLGEFDE